MADHRYDRCRDQDCPRLACRAWREAAAEYYQLGYEEGILNCPRRHEGE